MARPAKPWFRKSDGWWYATLNGEQTKLARGRADAYQTFHALKAGLKERAASAKDPSFKKLADLFLDRSQRENAPQTYANQRHYLQAFVDAVGARRARQLKV